MVMIQIQLLPEVEARLAAEAEARGMALESYLRAFVEEKILEDRAIHTQRRQAVEAMFAFSGRSTKVTNTNALCAGRHL